MGAQRYPTRCDGPRVFGINIETCPTRAGAVWNIACIEDPEVFEKILTHLDTKAAVPEASRTNARFEQDGVRRPDHVRIKSCGLGSA